MWEFSRWLLSLLTVNLPRTTDDPCRLVGVLDVDSLLFFIGKISVILTSVIFHHDKIRGEAILKVTDQADFGSR